MLAIYILIIRDEVASYIDIWNNYSIQVQKERPYMISSKPKVNYFLSIMKKIPNYKRPIDPKLIEKLYIDTIE